MTSAKDNNMAAVPTGTLLAGALGEGVRPMDSKTREARPMVPPDGSFLDAVKPADIDGPPSLGEKEMLLGALRFYFGPAQWWNAVAKNTDIFARWDDDKNPAKLGLAPLGF
jgi:hypothetical protein